MDDEERSAEEIIKSIAKDPSAKNFSGPKKTGQERQTGSANRPRELSNQSGPSVGATGEFDHNRDNGQSGTESNSRIGDGPESDGSGSNHNSSLHSRRSSIRRSSHHSKQSERPSRLRSHGKRLRKLRKRKSGLRRRSPFAAILEAIVDENPETDAPVWGKDRSNMEMRTPLQEDFSELPFADTDIASSEALEPISTDPVSSDTELQDLGAMDLSAREFDERSAILACPNDCSRRLLEASKKEKILRDLLDQLRSDHDRELTEKYDLGVYESWDRAKEFLNKEHAREIQQLEADVQSQKIHTERLQAIYESESQRIDANYEAEIARLNALLQAYEVEKISRPVQVSFEDGLATSNIMEHSSQQTEVDFAPLVHSSQQTEADFAPLTDSSQQTKEDCDQMCLEWEQAFAEERKTNAEKLQQVAEEKCRLEARISKLCGEKEVLFGEATNLRKKIQLQQDQIGLLNSQHEQDLYQVQSLTQQLEDEALDRVRPVQASGEELSSENIFHHSFQQTEDDFAQLQLSLENELDCERRNHAEKLQQAIDEKCDAQDELADTLVELGGLREKVHSRELEMELLVRKSEREVHKVHEKYDCIRRIDEDKKQRKLYYEARKIWHARWLSGTDKRSEGEFERDHRLQRECHDFDQQFPEDGEPLGADIHTLVIETIEPGTEMDTEEVGLFDGRTSEIETREQSTEMHADEIVLHDRRVMGIETKDQSTETDTEEKELRSGCVSPIPSSLLFEPQGGEDLMEIVKKDAEERIAREKEFAEQRIAECIAFEKESAEKRIAREMEIAEERLLYEKGLAEERIAYERKTAEEEVQKVHAKYDCQRKQDEERRRVRMTEQREGDERRQKEKRKELYEEFLVWRMDDDDPRSQAELNRDYHNQMKRYDLIRQFLGDDTRTMTVETKEQSTETDAREVELRHGGVSSAVSAQLPLVSARQRLSEGRPGSSEDVRSGNVSPASSSVLSLLASRRECSIYSEDSSEEASSQFSDDEVGPPVLQSDPDTPCTKSTNKCSIGTTGRSPVSRNLEEVLKNVVLDAAMSEDVEGLKLHGDESASVISLLSSLVRNASKGASDQVGETIPCGGPKGSDSMSSGGETETSASSCEVFSSVMSTAFLKTMDQFSKMAAITSDAVMQLKQRPVPSDPRIRLSPKKRRRMPRQYPNPTQQLVRELETTLQATMESLTLTQKRLDDAEIRQRESAEIIHKLEGNQQSVQRTQEQVGCLGAERKIPSSGPQTEEENPSSSALHQNNAVETDSAPAKPNDVASTNATERMYEADTTSRSAVMGSRKDFAIQPNYDFCNEKCPVMRYEIDRRALEVDKSDC